MELTFESLILAILFGGPMQPAHYRLDADDFTFYVEKQHVIDMRGRFLCALIEKNMTISEVESILGFATLQSGFESSGSACFRLYYCKTGIVVDFVYGADHIMRVARIEPGKGVLFR